MKRAHTRGGVPTQRPKRRPKASEACVACRKAKTRCEPDGNPAQGGCHRCTVLFVKCSFTEASSSGTSPGLSSGSLALPYVSGALTAGGSQQALARPLEISPFDATGITPEDLLTITSMDPEKAHWSTAPMDAMHELTARPSNHRSQQDEFPVSAEGVLGVEQIKYLQDIFETHYTPWLNLPYTFPSPTSPPSLSDFLTLARCAITARHLPPTSFAAVLPRLQKLVEHAILVHMFNTSRAASPEAVQALLILALWSPAVGPLPSEVQDGGRIAKAAVAMAVSIGLNESMNILVAFRQRITEGNQMTAEDEEEHKQLMYNTQLWSSLCNTEWSFCLGTNQAPASKPVEGMYDILNPRVFLGVASIEDIRGFRLYLIARLLEATNRGLEIKLKDLKTFTTEMEGIFSVFGGTRNCLLPLQATFPHERMHLDVVLMLAYWKVLLTLFHGLTQIRVFMEHAEPNKPWLQALEESNIPIASRWGIMSVNAAQSVIITFLDIVERCQASVSPHIQGGRPDDEVRFSPPLATAPDSLFAMVLFAASAMLIVRTMTVEFRRKRSITWFTTGALLTKLAETLDAIAISNEHAPRRAAAVIRELKRVWDEKISAHFPIDHSWPRLPSGAPAPHIPAFTEVASSWSMSERLNGRPQPNGNGDSTGARWPWSQGSTSSGAGFSFTLNEHGIAPSYPSFDGGIETGAAAPAPVAPISDEDFWANFMGMGGMGAGGI